MRNQDSRAPERGLHILHTRQQGVDTSKSILSRSQAQHRVDQIQGFWAELNQLEEEAILVLPHGQRERVNSHHDTTIRELAKQFDVDITASQKQMSWGMRIVSFLGALALAASAFFFFYRVWGLLFTPVQVLFLIGAPLLAVVGMEFLRKRERIPYFTSLIGLIAFACFVLNLSVLGSIFNITPSQNAFVAWAAFALILSARFPVRDIGHLVRDVLAVIRRTPGELHSGGVAPLCTSEFGASPTLPRVPHVLSSLWPTDSPARDLDPFELGTRQLSHAASG